MAESDILRRSGTSLHTTAPSRAGNHRLKNALFVAAFVAIRHDPAARAYYDRKRAEGKRHNAALTCLARRRCDLILAMLKTGRPYRKPHPQTTNTTQDLPQAA